MKTDWAYSILRAMVRFWVGFFFKEVTVRNAQLVPGTGPLLLALNHPNNLLDSVLIASVMKRQIHFLATGQLFRNPIVAKILRSVGAIPVYRQQDGGNEEKTAETFAAVTEQLRAGSVVAIYPEGVTHSDPFLHKIKTGAARMALQAEVAGDFQLGLKIMPVGINFLARKSFRQRVMINFGEPLQPFTEPVLEAIAEREAVYQLTEKLQHALQQQILHLEAADLEPLIHDLEDVYKGYLRAQLLAEGEYQRAEDFNLSRRIIEAVHFYRDYFPARFEQLRDALLNYKRRRDYLAVREEAFRNEMREGFATGLYTRLLLEGIGGLPLFLYGASQHLIPYLIPRLLSHFSARKETDYATIRFLSSIMLFPLCYLLQSLLCWYLFGFGWSLLYLISLPFSGAYALRYIHGVSYFRRKVHLLHLFMNERNLLEKLAQERAEIIKQLDQARAEFLQLHSEVN